MVLNKAPLNATVLNGNAAMPSAVAPFGVDFHASKQHMDASAPRQSMDASSTRWTR